MLSPFLADSRRATAGQNHAISSHERCTFPQLLSVEPPENDVIAHQMTSSSTCAHYTTDYLSPDAVYSKLSTHKNPSLAHAHVRTCARAIHWCFIPERFVYTIFVPGVRRGLARGRVTARCSGSGQGQGQGHGRSRRANPGTGRRGLTIDSTIGMTVSFAQSREGRAHSVKDRFTHDYLAAQR